MAAKDSRKQFACLQSRVLSGLQTQTINLNDPESRKTKLLSPVGVKEKICFTDSLCNEFHQYSSTGFLGFVCSFGFVFVLVDCCFFLK